ncbi:monovalent cation/H(+) antiporter subunit G [Desulfoluna spongiiphila]|uniref:monovalent cation/H(+) antiporter subunit G n=1 Tax=Desulfoluna spongiiphila TaxID=419481 RepID=UPI0012593742|nr:monovalent cation/H(+) antiporter subunit G [Desulfoluna spongiiphila]VVS93344.1 na+/h+ antiporter subunit g [Desulfoluna spongiiphila]
MTYVSLFIIALGIFFFFAGAVGVIRFPDFYSRLHPAGMIDSMGLLLSMSGLALYVLSHHGLSGTNVLTAIKIILIVIFVYITSPTATHAIVDAGIRAGLAPWTKKKNGGSDDDSH